jgi:voltage-gated potassium channel
MDLNTKKYILFKILSIMLFISLVVALGSFGFWYIEDYGVVDAIYMTVITLTTTGFQEVVPLTQNGKIFTMALLLVGVGVVTYSLTSIMNHIVSIDFSSLRREKMEKKISNLKGHTIVCGYGRMGEVICKKLHEENITFVVVEQHPELIALLKKNQFLYIEGDASSDENLEKAGVQHAKTLVSVVDNDADGLYIALAGRTYNPELNIVVRANEKSAEKRMIRAGANRVILPFVMSGLKVAESVIFPEVEESFRISTINNGKDTEIKIIDYLVNESSDLIGKSINTIGKDIKKMIIVGIKKNDNSFVFNPGGEYVFCQGDTLISMGEREHCESMMERFNLICSTEQVFAA